MILTGEAIAHYVLKGRIKIDPFDKKLLNPNSYNVRLGDTMCMQAAHLMVDCRKRQPILQMSLIDGGFLLNPGRLYLAHTMETVGSDAFAPMLNGRSSVGRLGVQVHMTAGFGDIGFIGQWTLEITTVNPIKLYPGMEIAQIAFFEVRTSMLNPPLYKGKYQHATGVGESLLHVEESARQALEGADVEGVNESDQQG
jgi:dCTP deaminase